MGEVRTVASDRLPLHPYRWESFMYPNKISQFFVNMRKILRIRLATLAWLLASPVLFAGPLAAQEAGQGAAVGTVSLVLGKAWVEAADGDRQTIKSGHRVQIGDLVETASNGHVHIRFDDKALVSVRPDSQLQVVRYDYDPLRPEQSSVKFNLLEGVTRSISGDAAHAARQRFRLNTPIAAIGVRGTDFVVSASQQTVRALVNEGAIVVAPFSSDCLADDFGPCAINAVELTGTSLQMVELDSETSLPRLMPATHEREPQMMQQEVQLALAAVDTGGEAAEKTAGTDVYLENVTSRKVAAEVASVGGTSTPRPEPTPPPQVPVTEPDFTPEAPVPVPDLTSRQLVWAWGRWAGAIGSGERITLDYEVARTGREVTVGNLDYTLFREPTGGGEHVRDGLGIIGFNLHSAQAAYNNGNGVFVMQVRGGELSIDFDNLRFATRLDLNHSLTGDVRFTADGRVFQNGIFNSVSETQRMAGAVTLDGQEAGYFFEKQLENGGVSGLTLWDKK